MEYLKTKSIIINIKTSNIPDEIKHTKDRMQAIRDQILVLTSLGLDDDENSINKRIRFLNGLLDTYGEYCKLQTHLENIDYD